MSVSYIDYNESTQTLRLKFDGGEVYDYFFVPHEVGRLAEVGVAENFKTAIKGVYPHRRVR